MNKKIKKQAYEFLSRYKLKKVSAEGLSKAVEKLGYTLILFNKALSCNDVETIVNNLNLQDYILRSRGFTYADGSYRLLFVNEDLNDEEKVLVLAHEIGHIVLNHIKSGIVIGNDVKEEYDANEFAHYLLNPNLALSTKAAITSHKKLTIGICVFLMIVVLTGIAVSMIKKEQSYYGNYYVTDTGNKYHKKECIFTKDKTTVRRLNKKEFEEGNYEACDICLPDK